MNFEEIEMALSVIRNKSFSLAAQELSYSQPTISKHIDSLEKELRAALRERLGETGAVLSEYFTEFEENGMLTLTLRSECEERIDEETLRP